MFHLNSNTTMMRKKLPSMNKRKGILFENWLTRHSRICFTPSFLHTRIYISYNFFLKNSSQGFSPARVAAACKILEQDDFHSKREGVHYHCYYCHCRHHHQYGAHLKLNGNDEDNPVKSSPRSSSPPSSTK